MQPDPTHSSASLPLRLIEIGHKGSTTLRLVESSQLTERPEYFALSHCWGDGTHVVKTNERNIDQHYQHIKWATLPPMFRQAVYITQQLDCRYLWIDSLCIIQDVEDDFQKECARMSIIYLNCRCMISASDAWDSSKGFLNFWDERGNSPGTCNFCPHESKHIRPENAQINWSRWFQVISGRLSTRGWACQERQLAPRILHYTDHGFYGSVDHILVQGTG